MAILREFNHCHYCRNGCLVFMCKGCDGFKNYVPRVSAVQCKVIKLLLDNPSTGLHDWGFFNHVEARTKPGEEFTRIDPGNYDLLTIRQDTLKGLIDRKIIILDWTNEKRNFAMGLQRWYKLNEKIKWRLQ